MFVIDKILLWVWWYVFEMINIVKEINVGYDKKEIGWKCCSNGKK